MPDNTVPIESQSPSQLELAECDFRGIAGLAKLKVCINYEYHREAAIEGHQPAFAWLEKEYPCWRVKPIKDVPPHLVKERIERLKQKELLAAANQLLLSPNEIPANDQAFAAGRPLPPLPVNITDEALAKVEGLSRERYGQLIAERDGIAAEIVKWKLDWSLPDETIINNVRAFLKLCRPVPPIYQERGNSATMKQLQVICKALVVYRLLVRAKLTIPQARERMFDWKLPALYSERKDERWNEARDLASFLQRKLKKGEFAQALQNFIMTAQGAKFLKIKSLDQQQSHS